jgi:hypothetical protein
MKELSYKKVKIFKIKNRRGYAATCLGCLTEGRTPYQAYLRMKKALKRSGLILKDIKASSALRLVVRSI